MYLVTGRMSLYIPIYLSPIYKGHSRESENVPLIYRLPFIYRLKLYALHHWENEAAFYRQ